MNWLSDQDPMPFGKFKGRSICEVPAWYLDWLRDQPELLVRYPLVKGYLEMYGKAIDLELENECQS